MYIRSMQVESFKGVATSKTFTFSPSVNVFVGNNNSGKSTAFEAFRFLQSGFSAAFKEDDARCNQGDGDPRVEVEFAGDLSAELADDRFAKLRPYIHTSATGEEIIRVERSATTRSIMQGSRAVELDAKKACFYSTTNDQFENPSGIDALFKSIFDAEFIWAETSPSDVSDFAATKILGKLIESSISSFMDSDAWSKFAAAHSEAFQDDTLGLVANTVPVAQQMEELVSSQYGPAGIRFNFNLPDSSFFLKHGEVLVTENGTETPLSAKGSGMQRAAALALIQLWASTSATAARVGKPLFLFIDEPETWLHPRAQDNLARAIAQLGTKQQIFIITHSPYMLRHFITGDHSLIVFRDGGELTRSTSLGEIQPQASTSLAEINYRAFGMHSIEFFNEVYGALHAHAAREKGEEDISQKELEKFFERHGFPTSLTWTRSNGKSFPATQPTYIRNTIHHPENTCNEPYEWSDLETTTVKLLDCLRRVSASPAYTATDDQTDESADTT